MRSNTSVFSIFDIRLLAKLASVDKINSFCADLSENFKSMCEHMVEKFSDKDAKKGDFCNRMGFCKKSNIKNMG